ncbi:MAG: nucleotidyltransferase domain-containing protein [Defluviitaleaceae bacterium]|nr:nucleotidyltransferase domain-containing protein [Defluviitaleaceae bacterium]MCL2240847.1 nucleotidyltransferase domain-containing protein [Defluviitaleaceae bacterium]
MYHSNFVLSKVTDDLSHNTKHILGDKLRKIILYGSYARGDHNDDSDLDIMVLADFNENEKPHFEEAIDKLASRTSLSHDITISLLLKDLTFFETHINILPYYRNVALEGIELYAAP